MKSILIAILFVTLFGLATEAQNSANGSGPGATAAAGSATTLPQGISFLAELTKTLDAKKLKVSDPVTAKLSDDVLAGDKLLIRKGSKIFGHVTEVVAHSKEHPESRLGIVFDRALLPDGREIVFHGTIRSYTPTFTIRTPTAIGSGDDAMNRASGPVRDATTGQVYEHNPNPRQDVPVAFSRAATFPIPGSGGLNLDTDSSVFLSNAHTVKLEGGSHLYVYVAK
ncbi:MAG TPA: hypothetical protein VHA33_25210 [Candidatus Angelobacter sp.]|jgi:hypothetical protein|nr:hypothetical protein [Candidatus Angelobacter sp.]